MPFKKKSDYTPEAWAALVAKRNAARFSKKKPTEKVGLTVQYDNEELSYSAPPVVDTVEPILIDQPPPDDILSQEEIEAIYAAALVTVAKDRKEERRKKIMEKALHEARTKAGMIKPETEHQKFLAEMVEITIELPSLRTTEGKAAPPDPIIVDQQIFHNGVTRRVPRSQAQYLIDLMWRMKAHVAQVDGRQRRYYDSRMGEIFLQPGQTGPAPRRHVA